jgi:antitoxin ParD1/3/4
MSEIFKISVALTGEQLDRVRGVVETGEYATTSEVIRDALRAWDDSRDVHLRPQDIRRLRSLIDEGRASGPAKPLDWGKLRKEARARVANIRRKDQKKAKRKGR